MPTRVVNMRTAERWDARVDRGSSYGNPYSHVEGTKAQYKVKDRAEAIAKYKQWLKAKPGLVIQAVRELRGKALGCWCVDDDGSDRKRAVVCHAQVLARMIDDYGELPAVETPTEWLTKQAVGVLGGYDPREHGAKCDECPLKGRHPPVRSEYPTAGPSAVKLVIIGEGPGRVEISEGKPFRGPSGRLLNQMLHRAGFDRHDAFVSNAAHCMGDTEWEKERAAACCAERLVRELKELPPGAPILTLGAPAAKTMLGRGAILRTRGFIWTLPEIDGGKIRAAQRSLEKRQALDKQKFGAAIDRAEQSLWRLEARAQLGGRIVIPTIHPAFILRGGEAHVPMLRVDVRRAVRWAMSGPLKLLDEGGYEVARTPEELRRALRKLRTKSVVIDVETVGPEPLVDKMTMFGIAEVPDGDLVKDEDVRVVLVSPPRNSSRERRRLQRALREMAEIVGIWLRGKTVVGHNFMSFDALVTPRYGIEPKKVEDSLIAHHAFASHMRQGLDHVVSMYCEVSPWKIAFKTKGAEEKGGVQSKWMGGDELDAYNAIDVRGNAIAWRRMQADLEPFRDVYSQDMALARVCQSMMRAGFQFDEARATELSAQLKARAGGLLGTMRALVGKSDFHPARPKDLRAALFGKLQVRPLAITKTGLASTASGTLEAVKNPDTKAGRLADLILRWRATQKTRATFLDGIRPHSDGRVRPSWKAFGTVTGRLACRSPNLMNLPRWSRSLEDSVRECYVAAPGHVLLYFDLKQSEMRMAAYLSGDRSFIDSCEKGDVHANNAKILFPKAREALERDPKGDNCPRHSKHGSVRAACNCGKPFRDLSKGSGFGILYQADAETIYKVLRSKPEGADVSLRDVEAMFVQIHKVYARYYAFCQENLAFCRQHGHVREHFSGRVRWLGFYPAITDASNFCVQAGIASLMNMRITPLHDRLPEGARIVAQVHDSLICEAKCGRVADDTQRLIKELWDEPIVTPTNGLVWKMPIDGPKVGERWSDFG